MKRRVLSFMLAFGMALTGCNANVNTEGMNTGNVSSDDTEDKKETKENVTDENGIIYNDGFPWTDSDLKLNIDNCARPDVKDDFHFAVNYDWLKESEIREDATSESSFTAAERNTTEKAMSLLKDKSIEGHDAELIQSLYEAVTDWDKRNEQGLDPIKPVLEDIAGIQTIKELDDFICDPDRSNCVNTFVSIANETDLNDSQRYITYINNDTLLLEDAAEYSALTSAGERAYEAKKALVKAMLTRLGMPEDEAEARFNRVMGFEEALASVSLTRAELNDPEVFDKINNVYTEDETGSIASAFPLKAFIKGFGYDGADRYALYQPKVIKKLDELYTKDNLDVMKDYMTIHYLLYTADKLDRECYELAQKRINMQYGTSGSADDDTAAYNTILKLLPEPLEKVYLEKYDADKMKEDITDICEDAVEGYKVMLESEDWLADETRKAAKAKLSRIKINAVYPEKWNDYSDLDLKGLSYLECCRKINGFGAQIDKKRTGSTVDKEMWTMNILQCNAFYNKQDNSINIILGILDDAFYSEDMGREELLGGIGCVIGHELSHAIDEKGSQFDEEGSLKTWWSEEDKKAYEERAEAVSGYFDGITGFNKTAVQGSNVKAEAIADMAGMKVMLYIAKGEAGFDYDRFFRQYARIWRSVMTPEAEYDKLLKDQHPLNYLRTNVTVSQFDEFINTYDIKEGNGMYLKPDERILVW